jgi:hypothetical protein
MIMSELLNPQTFTVPVLPAHRDMPEEKQPRFVFRARTWRETIELEEITASFREHPDRDGPIAELMFPAIKKYLVAEESADPEGLTYFELVQLFASMRECEKIELSIKKNLQLPLPSGEKQSAPTLAPPNTEAAPAPDSSKKPASGAAEPDAKNAKDKDAGD